ncbi:hypothetical protein [Rhodospirillum sp. A1_3_36]|uniref:hypothetical protein n=1 Tax=Rhodospirillum sp. A1_3_36 TaxID=3391666 RepID=UPI0039A5092F
MSFTEWLKKNITDAQETLNAEITKFKSKDLLEGGGRWMRPGRLRRWQRFR